MVGCKVGTKFSPLCFFSTQPRAPLLLWQETWETLLRQHTVMSFLKSPRNLLFFAISIQSQSPLLPFPSTDYDIICPGSPRCELRLGYISSWEAAQTFYCPVNAPIQKYALGMQFWKDYSFCASSVETDSTLNPSACCSMKKPACFCLVPQLAAQTPGCL